MTKFLQRDENLIYDEKVMQDIDDLSDCDKVSLISDIELTNETSQDDKDLAKEKLGELNFNLKNISKLNKDGLTTQVKRVSNGIKISKDKFKCSHNRTCSTCYELPVDPLMVNIGTQEQLTANLTLTAQERL